MKLTYPFKELQLNIIKFKERIDVLLIKHDIQYFHKLEHFLRENDLNQDKIVKDVQEYIVQLKKEISANILKKRINIQNPFQHF